MVERFPHNKSTRPQNKAYQAIKLRHHGLRAVIQSFRDYHASPETNQTILKNRVITACEP